MHIVSEWKVFQQLASMSLPEINHNLSTLVTNKQGSLELFKQIASASLKHYPQAVSSDLETNLTLFSRISAPDNKEKSFVLELYEQVIPYVKELISTLPSARAAKVLIALAAHGVTDQGFYVQSNSILQSGLSTLEPGQPAQLANWFAPYLVSLPDRDTLYPQLELLPTSLPDSILMLQGFIAAKKGSYDYFKRTAGRFLKNHQELEESKTKASAVHLICRTGIQDLELFSRLEDLIGQFEDLDLTIGGAVDLASVKYRPEKLLRTIHERAEEIDEIRNMVCLQWVYSVFGEDLPKELGKKQSFLMLRGGLIRDYFLSKRISKSIIRS